MIEAIESATVDGTRYYQCPECGFRQRSNATDRIRCHRCDRSYRRVAAKRVEKTPDEGHGFATYTRD